jgi:hypothetical protein
MEFYNTMYNITADFTEFVYTIVDILTRVSSTHTLTLTPDQYSATDLASRPRLQANLCVQLQYLHHGGGRHYYLQLLPTTPTSATWAEDLLHFDAAAVESEIATCTSHSGYNGACQA